jgi:hypothetical protein
VTNGHEFQWWRFFANCGRHSTRIIGDGIVKVHIRLGTDAILVERTDGSVVTVLTRPRVTVCESAVERSWPPQW